MLFLIFGFLEFYDSDDSDRPLLAPLLSLPVTVTKGGVNQATRTYDYLISHSGEDLAENHTLFEKLKRDFTLNMPDFDDEGLSEIPVEDYFKRIEHTTRSMNRWKVRRQLSLGMLSFGKLAIWSDLDPHKNPGILSHELLESIFSGGNVTDGRNVFHAEDYHIDEREDVGQLIYDADSSQHSAIIDVLAGKNMVINGPPGTGKSQTITNVIAAALTSGKTVLFVSEKLAALEVVWNRLNMAGLGHFCLELHSHKTQKKRFIEDIKKRIETTFSTPAQFQEKIETLKRHKNELAQYAAHMGSRVGNALGQTVNEIFWGVAKRRQSLGDLASEVSSISFPEASQWAHDDIQRRASTLGTLAELFELAGGFGPENPWWGFTPVALTPSDDDAISKIVRNALSEAQRLEAASDDRSKLLGMDEEQDLSVTARMARVLSHTPSPPENMDALLLSRMFDSVLDQEGRESAAVLERVSTRVLQARRLLATAKDTLVDGKRIPAEEAAEIMRLWQESLIPSFFSLLVPEAVAKLNELRTATDLFEATLGQSHAPYGHAGSQEGERLAECAGKLSWLEIEDCPLAEVANSATSVDKVSRQIEKSLSNITLIAARGAIPFTGTPESAERLASPEGIPELVPGCQVSQDNLEEALRFSRLPLVASQPLSEIERIRSELTRETARLEEAFSRCSVLAERLSIAFDGSEMALARLRTLARISAAAPKDLLRFRSHLFSHDCMQDVIDRARKALDAERQSRDHLISMFHLDVLPGRGELVSAMLTLRRPDSLLNFFNREWRCACKLFDGLAKTREKRTSRKRAECLSSLVTWLEGKEVFLVDRDISESLGGLFRGLDTDIDKAARLQAWRMEAKNAMAQLPGLLDHVDLGACRT